MNCLICGKFIKEKQKAIQLAQISKDGLVNILGFSHIDCIVEKELYKRFMKEITKMEKRIVNREKLIKKGRGCK